MAVIGQTGTGKSTLVKHILPVYKSLCVIDPKRTFEYPDIPIFDNPASIEKSKPIRFIYRPKPSLLDNLSAYDRVLKYCYLKRNIMIFIDDVVGIIPRFNPPPYLKVCYQMGRERNVGVIACFQRPSGVPMVLMTEANTFCVFRLTRKDDIKRVQEYVPTYNPEELPDKYTFFVYNPDTIDYPVKCKLSLTKETGINA